MVFLVFVCMILVMYHELGWSSAVNPYKIIEFRRCCNFSLCTFSFFGWHWEVVIFQWWFLQKEKINFLWIFMPLFFIFRVRTIWTFMSLFLVLHTNIQKIINMILTMKDHRGVEDHGIDHKHDIYQTVIFFSILFSVLNTLLSNYF